ncbi:MAG: SRPBCC family protein [Actinomycetia bacterium]|nr:SRPBCC family protein [Actinomycetes bacterium]
MSFIKSSIQINSSPKDVYEMAQNMEKFSDFMPDVEKVTVVEKGDKRAVTEWVTSVEGIPICWTEEDTFDDEQIKIHYQLLEGDLDKFEGSWSFDEADGGTIVTLTVDFDFGMPTLADLLGPILKVKVQENSEMMLAGMKKKIES